MKDMKENDYECDEAVRTLLKAEEIKMDKDMMKRVSKKLGSQSKAIKSLQDLKEAGADMDKEDDA